MYKKAITQLFLLILLVSCASPTLQPTATPTTQPTSTATATQTPLPTETLTPTLVATVTAGPETFDRPIKIRSIDRIENVMVSGGAVVNGALIADETLPKRIREVTVPDLLGGYLLIKVVAVINGIDPDDDQAIADFIKKLAKVQKGELPCSTI